MNSMIDFYEKEHRNTHTDAHTDAHIKPCGVIHMKLFFSSSYTRGVGLVRGNEKVFTFLLNPDVLLFTLYNEYLFY